VVGGSAPGTPIGRLPAGGRLSGRLENGERPISTPDMEPHDSSGTYHVEYPLGAGISLAMQASNPVSKQDLTERARGDLRRSSTVIESFGRPAHAVAPRFIFITARGSGRAAIWRCAVCGGKIGTWPADRGGAAGGRLSVRLGGGKWGAPISTTIWSTDSSGPSVATAWCRHKPCAQAFRTRFFNRT